MGFTGCEKTLFFEGYGLQPVHKRLKIGTALAGEGRISIHLPTFSAASLALDFEARQQMIGCPTSRSFFARCGIPPL